MLCPEIWDFKAPEHHFQTERASHRSERLTNVVNNHYFNHSVSVVLPDIGDVPDVLRDSFLDDTDYYKITDLRPVDLVNKEFVEAFVKKGELTLLTVGRKIDVHNVVAICPAGQLVLSLVREDYQKLGLEGKPTFFDRKAHSRYVVTINLNEESFAPGKKNYERVRSCLENNLIGTFDVILAWDPPDDELCPSSVAAWFHDRGYRIDLCRQKFTQRNENSLFVPMPEPSYDFDKFFEWLGIFSIDGDTTNGKADDYVNTYACPTPRKQFDNVQYVQCTGFFTRKRISKIWEATMSVGSSGKALPWTSFHVQGFDDSPVSWGLKEHNFYTDGDNSYTIVLLPNDDCVVRKSTCSNKKPRIFQ